MELPNTMALHHPIFIREDGLSVPLPSWAKAELWLGWWCRRFQFENNRLLVVAILPSCELAAAFAGLGCLIAGAQQFHGGLNWGEFRELSIGEEVFWKVASSSTRYGGIVIEPTDLYSDLVSLRITTGKKNKIGSIWCISEATFKQHLFSEDNLPTLRGTVSMENAMRLHRNLGLETKPRWIWTAGSEARVVTNQSRFREALAGLDIGAQGSEAIPFEDALCAPRGNDQPAKLRILSVGHPIGGDAPVTILDGEAAFHRIQHIETGNILILLERTEYTAEIHNFLLDLHNVAKAPSPDAMMDFPSRFPPGMEFSAFVFQNSQ